MTKKVARSHSLADENIKREACESIDSDDSEYLEYVRELEERFADRDDAGAAPGGHVLGSRGDPPGGKTALKSRSSALRACRRLGLQGV